MNPHLINTSRTSRGFLTIEQTLALAEAGNIVLDPFSVLISAAVILGENNLFYPNVVIEAQNAGKLTIGNGNIFYPNTLILADSGEVQIGNNGVFGDGGCSIKANLPTATISIADNGRYCSGAQILGNSLLGNGTQVLGAITVQNCTLEGGGDFTEADPDKRGAVLKGHGLARNIHLATGDVLNGTGTFLQAQTERQMRYHPKHTKVVSNI